MLVAKVVSTVRKLYAEMLKFGVVGAIGVASDVGSSNLLWKYTGLSHTVASVGGTCVATVTAYIGNRYWTYKDRDKIDRHREMLFFFLINGVAAVIEVMFVFISKYGLGQDGTLAVNIASYGFGLPLGMLFRLYCYRTFVFPEGAEPEVVPAAASAPLYPSGQPAHQAQPHVHQRPVPETAGR